MLVGLSMRRQCRAICVKRAIYFSRSRRECPRRYFGREESDSVNLQRPRGRGSRRRLRRLCLLIGLDTCCQAAAVARGGAAESDATAARRSDTPSMTMPLFVHEENSRCGWLITPFTDAAAALNVAPHTLSIPPNRCLFKILLPFCRTSFWRQFLQV